MLLTNLGISINGSGANPDREAFSNDFLTVYDNQGKATNNKIRNDVRAPYSSVRGMIAPKGFKNNSEILMFQFNPTEIGDSKNTDWMSRNSLGESAKNYFWSKGGDRVISFRLHFEATAGVNTPMFYNNAQYGDETFDKLIDNFPRGTIDMVEKLMAFMYPVQNGSTSRFVSMGVLPNTRFTPPPIAIFIYGEYYLECVVDNLDVSHELFNEQLIPIRSTANITLKVLEAHVVKQDSRLQLNK